MDYLNFKQEIIQLSIKHHKRLLTTHRGLTYLNVISAIYTGYILYNYPYNIMAAIIFGALIINIMWCLTQLQSCKYDLKLDKEYLMRIQKRQDDESKFILSDFNDKKLKIIPKE